MEPLELLVKRLEFTANSTIGELYISGVFFCYTLEDVARASGVKIKKETAIPSGRYRVKTTFSPKYQRSMPQILDVPMFQGIRIHGGNDKNDTEGCLLLGMHKMPDRIYNCKPALDHVYELIADAEAEGREVWITCENDPPGISP